MPDHNLPCAEGEVPALEARLAELNLAIEENWKRRNGDLTYARYLALKDERSEVYRLLRFWGAR